MNYINQNPVGIDIAINRVQDKLYNALSDKWGDIDGYGRVYKNIRHSDYKPEYFIDELEYREVLQDEISKFFFTKGNTKIEDPFTGNVTAYVTLYFCINLRGFDSLKRSDEQALIDVFSIIEGTKFKPNRIDQGIDSILSDFRRFSSSENSNLKFSDLQPYHVFKIEGEMQYFLEEKCQTI